MRPSAKISVLVGSFVLGLGGAAVANGPSTHTIGGNYHGHVASTVFDGTHAFTQYSNLAYKHASVDAEVGGGSYCSSTSQVNHVHCDGFAVMSVIDSHHYGPGITNHTMA
jgi:hypothetical protein